MAEPAIAGVRRGLDVRVRGDARWKLASLSGRLVELSGDKASSVLTLAFSLVREAQLLGEPAAWVTLQTQAFFAPDAAAGGVDLDALAVVRVARVLDLGRAADHLARSRAFGLIVIDLPPTGTLSMAVQSRLLGLAQKHEVALLFLTQKAHNAPSLGSLISLRGQASRKREGHDAFSCVLSILKDKRRAPGWSHAEVCRGPAGLH